MSLDPHVNAHASTLTEAMKRKKRRPVTYFLSIMASYAEQPLMLLKGLEQLLLLMMLPTLPGASGVCN